MIKQIAPLLLFVLVACASPQPRASNPPTSVPQEIILLEPFTHRLDQSLTLKPVGLTITFIGVLSDQRCGSCTASGNADVVLLLMITKPALTSAI